MTTGTLTLLSLLWALHASPATDVVYMKDPGIEIPATVDEHLRAQFKELQLWLSTPERPQWDLVAKTTPDKPKFSFNAPHDGLYTFSVIAVDRQDRNNPPQPQPNLKIVVDSKPPVVVLTANRVDPDTILVKWTVSDDNLDLPSLKLEYRTVDTIANKPTSDWTPAIVHSPVKEGEERITPHTGAAVEVRLEVLDLAKNSGSNVATVEAVPGGSGQPPPPPAPPSVAGNRATDPGPPPVGPPPPGPVVSRKEDIPPPQPPPPSPPERMERPPVWNPPAEVAPAPGSGGAGSGGVPLVQPGPSDNAINRVVAKTFAPGPEAPPAGGGSPVSPPLASPPAASGPRGPLPPLQIVNHPQVILEYKVRNSGVSGVKSVQVYLTEDNGQNWRPYGEPQNVEAAGLTEPKDGSPLARSLTVKLPEQEGIYGLYLVIYSGAGLSNPPPKEGTVPQMRLELDRTPPVALLFAPKPDPSSPHDRVLFAWQATDRNLGPQPIGLHWAERREGPWEPIGEPSLPNTSSYSWQLPRTLPPQVYLRLTVRDAAGNVSEAVTPAPIPIDLNQPEPVDLSVKASTP
jgi:hypothetical protein